MKKVIRLLSLAAATICFVLNIGPVITNKQINIGVVTGLAVALVFLLYAVKMNSIHTLIAKLWKKEIGKAILSFCAFGLIIVVAVGGYTFGRILQYSKSSDVQTEYIIVLGCKVNGTQPGPYLNGRIRKAREYLCNHPTATAILSGGKGDDEGISEAQCMYNCLTESGINGERLIMEDTSTATLENFKNSIALLQAKGVELKEITVITNDFHEYRASKFAQMCGLTAYPYPYKTPWIGYVPFVLREIYAVVCQIYIVV